MKNLLYSALAICAIALGFSACSSDDDEVTEEKRYIQSPTPLEAIDLGLPSGTKWGNMNVGAENPTEFGEYFCWGDTVIRGEDWAENYKYNWANSPFNNGYKTFNQNYFENNMLIYCPNGILAERFDAATKICGSEWRMPTEEEWKELSDNCIWEWTNSYKDYGVAGYIVYKDSVTKDNHIFLPAAGKRNSGSFVDGGKQGYYWSSTLYDETKPWNVRSTYFRNNFIKTYDYPYQQYYGFTIRPIHK